MKRLISVFPLILLIAAVGLLPACGASEPAVPTGPPVIKSFTVEDETIEPGEAPRFSFEVSNASAITIRQGGEVVFEIEATAAPGTEGASREPLGNVAYALPAGGAQPAYPYAAGIPPIDFIGTASGKVSNCVWKPGEEEEVDVELEVRSPDCQVARQELTLHSVPAESRRGLSRAPAMAMEHSANEFEELAAAPTGPPVIKSFSVEDETIEPGEAPRFSFEVSNASAITIRQGGKVVFEIEATAAPGTEGASRQPLGNVAHALPAGGTQTDYPYPAGVYPVGYKGGASGKPASCTGNGESLSKIKDSYSVIAEMEVRSPSGEKATQAIEVNVSATQQESDERVNLLINEFTVKTLEPKKDKPMEFFIDVGNAAVITMQVDEDGQVETFFRQDFSAPPGCPVEFKATVTGPPPTKTDREIRWSLIVTDGAGGEISQDRSAFVSSCD